MNRLAQDEKTIPPLQKLLRITSNDNGEGLILLSSHTFKTRYREPLNDLSLMYGSNIRMFDDWIFVRHGVADKLKAAQESLQTVQPQLQFLITYGFRPLHLQELYFRSALEAVMEESPTVTLVSGIEEAHRRCAYPKVGGHPTGGAVDLTLWDNENEREVDMGSPLYNFGPGSFFRSPVGSLQKANRILLRETMESAGFSPFNGEWWHYSYGDKEWGWYNGTEAIYETISTAPPPRFRKFPNNG